METEDGELSSSMMFGGTKIENEFVLIINLMVLYKNKNNFTRTIRGISKC